MCTDEEKGCSMRDLIKVKSFSAKRLLSNDIKYVMIRYILTELHLPEHSTVGTHRKQENA